MQRKIKRKFLSLMLAASLAGSSLAAFPMNVFAGTDKNGVIKVPKCVVKIQGDSSRCMKKSDLVQLETTLCEGAKFEGFVGGDPKVATVNNNGVVKAVGPGETTITARARLKGSSKIYTATCKIIVTGLIVESIEMEINYAGATVETTIKGTVYGAYGKKVVDGKLSEAGIGDVIEIGFYQNNSAVDIKDTIILLHSCTLKCRPGDILNVNEGGTLNVNKGSTLDCTSSNLNVNEGGTLNVNEGSTLDCTSGTLTVKPGGTLNVNEGTLISTSNLNVNKDGTLNVNGGTVDFHTISAYLNGTLNLNEGTLSCSKGEYYLNGTLTVESGGKLEVNSGGFILNGKLTVGSGGKLEVNSGGFFLNSSTFQVKNGEGYDTVPPATYSGQTWTGK